MREREGGREGREKAQGRWGPDRGSQEWTLFSEVPPWSHEPIELDLSLFIKSFYFNTFGTFSTVYPFKN